MKYNLAKALSKIGLFSIKGSYAFTRVLYHDKFTLMALLGFRARIAADETAVVDTTSGELINYGILYQQARQLAYQLHKKQHLKGGQKVALICRNHIFSQIHVCLLGTRSRYLFY